MKIVIFFVLTIITPTVLSQNLVPNPSFETYTVCPNNTGQINKAVGWDYIQAAQSAEYFNVCSTNTNVTVPKNFFGTNYQLPRTGNGYAGVQTIHNSGYMRGNICTQLSTPLLNNNYYLVKFYVVNVQSYFIANNNLALNFSNTLTYTLAANTTLNLPMHIYKFGNPVIKDTLNWTEIMGIYKANGTEQYITIGNFKDDANTKIDTTNYGWPNFHAAYYQIEDVSVEAICTPFWSYRDTTVAIGDSVLIGPAITGLNINWYDATSTLITNAPGIYVKPAITTTYTAVEDFCGNTNTIVVTVLPTGVKDMSYEFGVISLLPNPTNGLLTITSRYDFEKIELTNVTGQLLFTETVNNKTHNIQLQNFAEGIYFVRIVYPNGLSSTKKVIVSR